MRAGPHGARDRWLLPGVCCAWGSGCVACGVGHAEGCAGPPAGWGGLREQAERLGGWLGQQGEGGKGGQAWDPVSTSQGLELTGREPGLGPSREEAAVGLRFPGASPVPVSVPREHLSTGRLPSWEGRPGSGHGKPRVPAPVKKPKIQSMYKLRAREGDSSVSRDKGRYGTLPVNQDPEGHRRPPLPAPALPRSHYVGPVTWHLWSVA